MKNATFRQLRFFNAVARHLSFARAAEDLHVSAPAVTMQIKELEAEVGMPLFERQGRKISLTTSGEYMLVYSRRMMALLKDAEDAAARLQRVETGSLTIGLVGTTTYFIPALLSQFLKEHEGIEVKLLVGNRKELVQWLQNSEVDIAIMGKAPDELPTRAEPFAANPLVFVASPDHPLAGESGLRAEDLVLVALFAPVAGRLSDRHPPGLLGGVGLVLLSQPLLALVMLGCSVAAMFVGSQERKVEREILHDMHMQLKEVRHEIAELRQALEVARREQARAQAAAPSPEVNRQATQRDTERL